MQLTALKLFKGASSSWTEKAALVFNVLRGTGHLKIDIMIAAFLVHHEARSKPHLTAGREIDSP
jgi:hypothetical protein